MLSLDEAEERTRRGVAELERLIDRFNDEPEEDEWTRYKDLTSHLMSLLAETYGIADHHAYQSAYATSDEDDK